MSSKTTLNTKAYELKKNMNSKNDEPQKFLNLKCV